MISPTMMCAEEVKTGFHGDNIRVILYFCDAEGAK